MKLWQKFIEWLEAPRPCKKHGTEYLFTHGYGDKVDCSKCRDEWREDWMSKREDYFSN